MVGVGQQPVDQPGPSGGILVCQKCPGFGNRGWPAYQIEMDPAQKSEVIAG